MSIPGPAKVRFPYFDSLRGIAALSVFFFHWGHYSGANRDEALIHPFVNSLNVGVTIFFVISGFLLYRPFVQARVEGRPLPSILGYSWRRILRIVPAYWVALTLIVYLVANGQFSPGGYSPLIYYGFLQLYSREMALGGIFQAWSLCVEMSFYLLLPLYAALMYTGSKRGRPSSLRGELLILLLLAALSTYYKLVVLASDNRLLGEDSVWLNFLPGLFDQFAVGMALAVVSVWHARTGAVNRFVSTVRSYPLAVWAIAGALFTVVSLALPVYSSDKPLDAFLTDSSQYISHHLLFTGVALCVVLPAVFYDPDHAKLPQKILGSRLLTFCGTISYGIFLWHIAALIKLDSWGLDSVSLIHPYVTWTVFGLGSSAAIAVASYYLIERPALRLRHLSKPRKRDVTVRGQGSEAAAAD